MQAGIISNLTHIFRKKNIDYLKKFTGYSRINYPEFPWMGYEVITDFPLSIDEFSQLS